MPIAEYRYDTLSLKNSIANKRLDEIAKELGTKPSITNVQPDSADTANPKDLLGMKKPPMNLLPATGRIYGAEAMRNGAEKYGPYNWRTKKVQAMIYADAISRHLVAWVDGEDDAEDSHCPHLGHIIACAAILADAVEGGFLIDDRPPKGPAAKCLKRLQRS